MLRWSGKPPCRCNFTFFIYPVRKITSSLRFHQCVSVVISILVPSFSYYLSNVVDESCLYGGITLFAPVTHRWEYSPYLVWMQLMIITVLIRFPDLVTWVRMEWNCLWTCIYAPKRAKVLDWLLSECHRRLVASIFFLIIITQYFFRHQFWPAPPLIQSTTSLHTWSPHLDFLSNLPTLIIQWFFTLLVSRWDLLKQ